MNYLPENSQKINFFEVENTLNVIEVNPLDDEKSLMLLEVLKIFYLGNTL